MIVYGTFRYSPFDLSQALQELGWVHGVYRSASGNNRSVRQRHGEGAFKAVVAIGLSSVPLKAKKVFVVAPKSELELTNIPLINSDIPLIQAIEEANTKIEKVELHTVSIMEYVDSAAKPSFLNKVQTHIYQLGTNLQGPVRKQIISYLDSKLSYIRLRHFLKSNLNYAPLMILMDSPEAFKLRAVVERYRKGEDLAELELETSVASFDVSYITRASEKLQGV